MKNSTKIILLALALVFINCNKQQARKPISQKSGTFLKESAERNKKLIKNEELQIDSIIKSNPQIQYLASKKGYWYYYETKNEKDTLYPKKGDVAFFNYEIKDLKGNIIYSEVELKPQTYLVDKQNIMMGLRDGIKLMKKSEKVTFLFPSHMAYGYHGDDKKIDTNQPIMCKVTLVDLKKMAPKKESSAPATAPTVPGKMKDNKEDKQSSSTPK